MKVAFFVWPAGWASGHETFQASLLEGLLAQNRHEIVLVGDDAGVAHIPVPHSVRPVPRFPRRIPAIAQPISRLERAAAAVIREVRPDVMVACANFPFPNLPDIPLIATLHEVDFMDATDARWFDSRTIQQLTLMTRSALNRAVAVWANSSYTARRAVSDCGVDPRRTRVTAPAVRSFPSAPRPAPARAPYVAQVGWFHPRKNTPFVLRAWAAARRRGMEHHLVLIGRRGPRDRVEGALARQIVEYAGEFAGDVHVTGLVDRGRYGELLRNASALLVGSFQEGFCVPVIEAFALGTPVVAVNRTALTEVVGDVGCLVEPDETAFADALVSTVQSPPDPKRMREYAAQFTPEAQAGAAIDTLDRLASGSWPGHA